MAGVNVFICAIPLFEGVVDDSGDMQASVGFNMLRDALGGADYLLEAAGNMLLQAYKLQSASATTDQEDLAKTLNNMAVAYMASGRLPEALGALLESEKIYDHLQQPNDCAQGGVTYNIGVVYGMNGQHDKTAKYHAAAKALGYE